MIKTSKSIKIKDFIEKWNALYPYDRWWRKKYNVPFGGAIHRETSHIDMAIEYKENLYFKRLEDERTIKELKPEEDTLIFNLTALKQRNLFKGMSKADIDKDFNDLDLTEFDDVNIAESNV